jgi:hypothetical protein
MKKLLLTLLFGILGVGAYGQTIKSLGYNTTNGQVVYSGTNTLTFGYSVKIGSDPITINGTTISWGGVQRIDFEENRLFGELAVDTIIWDNPTNAATTRANLGLGNGITTNRTFVSYNGTNYTTNSVTISNGIITGWTQ